MSDRSSRRPILRRTIKCRHGKKTLSPILMAFFKMMSFISVFVESIQKDEFSKNHRCGRHQKGCSTTWNFFLAANWDTVQRGMSNSWDASRGATSTTIEPPLSRHAGFSLVLSVSVSHPKVLILSDASFQYEWQHAKSFGNYVRVSS